MPRRSILLRFLNPLSTGFLIGLFLAVMMFSAVPAQDLSRELRFQKHVIDQDFEGGYQVAVADINSDGRPDIIALSTNPSCLAWYENPTWDKRMISTNTEGNIDVAPNDIDSDGDIDLALASEFGLRRTKDGGDIHWLENPGDTNREWTVHFIDSIPTSHRVRWADLDGDGQKELLNLPLLGVGAEPPDYEEGLVFRTYSIPEAPRKDDWPQFDLDSSLHMAHGMAVVDWDSEVGSEVLVASFEGITLFHVVSDDSQTNHTFRRVQLGTGKSGPRPGQGASEVDVGHLGTEPFFSAIEPWHGNEVTVYTRDKGNALWRRIVIDQSFNDGHALRCADLDGNGNDEIIAGYRGPDYSLYLFRFEPATGSWNRSAVDRGGISVAGVFIEDLNQDGWFDIVAVGSATSNVVWYENRGD